MRCYYCPLTDFTCPYFNSEEMGLCELENSVNECDAFAMMNLEDLEEWEVE